MQKMYDREAHAFWAHRRSIRKPIYALEQTKEGIGLPYDYFYVIILLYSLSKVPTNGNYQVIKHERT
jgi:hypothetical protein